VANGSDTPYPYRDQHRGAISAPIADPTPDPFPAPGSRVVELAIFPATPSPSGGTPVRYLPT
jgi:hypothetical protein